MDESVQYLIIIIVSIALFAIGYLRHKKRK